jgi:hypothetical protein
MQLELNGLVYQSKQGLDANKLIISMPAICVSFCPHTLRSVFASSTLHNHGPCSASLSVRETSLIAAAWFACEAKGINFRVGNMSLRSSALAVNVSIISFVSSSRIFRIY